MDSRPRTPNEKLLREREARGWSQRRVAAELGTTEKGVSLWERGERIPSLHYQKKLCSLFGKSIEELGFIRTRTMDTPIPTTDGDNLTERLDQAETVIDLCWELWVASRPERAAHEIFRIIPRLYHMRLENISLLHHLRVQQLTIRCHGLLGAIYLDAIQNDIALYHFTQAHDLSAEIHDTDQTVTYLALIGDVLRRREDKRLAISRIELAREQADRASRGTRGHILQILAYGYSDTGSADSFEYAISESTDLLSHQGEGLDSVRHEFTSFGVHVIRGTAYCNLGQPLAALPYLDQGEKSLMGESVAPRWQALLQISRAQAFCNAGDLATGIELAKQGFLLAHKCQSFRQMNRVKTMLRKLEGSTHKDDKRVGDLRELLYETYVHGGQTTGRD